MKEHIYVAITGTQHYFGTDFLKVGQVVSLIKNPENRYDDEAIKAEIKPIWKNRISCQQSLHGAKRVPKCLADLRFL